MLGGVPDLGLPCQPGGHDQHRAGEIPGCPQGACAFASVLDYVDHVAEVDDLGGSLGRGG